MRDAMAVGKTRKETEIYERNYRRLIMTPRIVTKYMTYWKGG